jgi:hypothetical protein
VFLASDAANMVTGAEPDLTGDDSERTSRPELSDVKKVTLVRDVVSCRTAVDAKHCIIGTR